MTNAEYIKLTEKIKQYGCSCSLGGNARTCECLDAEEYLEEFREGFYASIENYYFGPNAEGR